MFFEMSRAAGLLVVAAIVLVGAGCGGSHAASRPIGGGSVGGTPPNQPALDAAASQARKVAGHYYTGAVVHDNSNKVDVYLANAPQTVTDRLRSLHPGVYVIHNAPRSRSAVMRLAQKIDPAFLKSKGIDVVAWGPAEDGHLRVGVTSDVAAAQAKLDAMYGPGAVRVYKAQPIHLLPLTTKHPSTTTLRTGATRRAGVQTPSALAMWTPQSGLVGMTAYQPTSGSIWILGSGDRLHEVLRLKTPVDSLQTMGPQAAIAATGGGRRLRYLLTTDGGHHWRRFRLRYPSSFATKTLGLGYRTYTVGNRIKMALLETRDGGKTWQRQRTPCQGISALTDLLTQRLAWLMCLEEPGAGNQAKALFRTIDGGKRWQPLADVPIQGRAHGGIQSFGYPQGMAFTRGGFGLLWESRGTLYVTRDGGKHWTPKWKLVVPDADFGCGGAVFPHGRGFVLVARGSSRPATLLETRDYGRTWHTLIRWRNR